MRFGPSTSASAFNNGSGGFVQWNVGNEVRILRRRVRFGTVNGALRSRSNLQIGRFG